MPRTASIRPGNGAYIDGLLTGLKWATHTLTYSFPTAPSQYGNGYGFGQPKQGFEAFNAQQEAAVSSILDMYASALNLRFVEVTETASREGTLRFAETNKVGTAWGYFPHQSSEGGDMWFNNSSGLYDSPEKGNYAWFTIIHEIGHALGLKHPHEKEGNFRKLPASVDSIEYTVMSYHSYAGDPTKGYTNGEGSYPQTLMMLDIAALQKLYGPNWQTNGGDTVYEWNPHTGEMFIDGAGQGAPTSNKIFMTVWDGGGRDTYDFSNYNTDLSIDLRPGKWSTVSSNQLADLGDGQIAVGNIANALQFRGRDRSLIEDAVGGAGDDVIIGNAADNKLTGGGGNDILDGLGGVDIAVYFGSRDQYLYSQNADNSYTITDLRGGSPDGVDVLFNIQLLQFADEILVPLGPDSEIIEIDEFGDIVTQRTFYNQLRGSDKADVIFGAAGRNVIVSLDGDDIIFSSPKPDKIYGGAGNDTFAIAASNARADRIFGGEGVDTLRVLGSQSVQLANFSAANASIEIWAGNGAGINGTRASNVFDFRGLTDQSGLSEVKGAGGRDIIFASDFGTTLYGNGGFDRLYGGAGDDTLYGGAGRDVTYGRDGDDTILVAGNDARVDRIHGGDGFDTIKVLSADAVRFANFDASSSSIESWDGNGASLIGTRAANTFDLRGLVDQSGLESIRGGAGNDTIYASDSDTKMFGGTGNDRLFSGAGNDSLTGGPGSDVFSFSQNFGNDVITDFVAGVDEIELDQTMFADYAAVVANTAQVGADVVLSGGGNALTLKGVSLVSLTEDDFSFI